MILVIIFLIFSSQSAVGQEIEAQLPLETLLERSIAYVKRPALVEWRKSSVLIGLETGQSIEYNDFNGRSYGINLRFPDEYFVLKTSILKFEVNQTDGSRKLAKTPFEQEGRPTRLEWQNGLEFPLVEGISQNLITIVPASEFVLSAVAQLNLYIYPELNHKPVQVLKDIVKFSMDESDRQILERSSPSAMRVHRGTHSMSLGLQWDNYYKTGFGWNMRFLYERPFLSSESHLSSWFSLALGVGYAL